MDGWMDGWTNGRMEIDRLIIRQDRIGWDR